MGRGTWLAIRTRASTLLGRVISDLIPPSVTVERAGSAQEAGIPWPRSTAAVRWVCVTHSLSFPTTGVLLFVMLAGMFPFETQDDNFNNTAGLYDIWLQQIKTSWCAGGMRHTTDSTTHEMISPVADKQARSAQ